MDTKNALSEPTLDEYNEYLGRRVEVVLEVELKNDNRVDDPGAYKIIVSALEL